MAVQKKLKGKTALQILKSATIVNHTGRQRQEDGSFVTIEHAGSYTLSTPDYPSTHFSVSFGGSFLHVSNRWVNGVNASLDCGPKAIALGVELSRKMADMMESNRVGSFPSQTSPFQSRASA